MRNLKIVWLRGIREYEWQISLAAHPIGKCNANRDIGTKLNKKKKILYYETKINDIKNDCKKFGAA